VGATQLLSATITLSRRQHTIRVCLLFEAGEERGTGLVHRRAWVVLGVLGMCR
jgi:hypothetical protein